MVCCLRYGERAAGAGVVEKWRARGRHWTALLAAFDCIMTAFELICSIQRDCAFAQRGEVSNKSRMVGGVEESHFEEMFLRSRFHSLANFGAESDRHS